MKDKKMNRWSTYEPFIVEMAGRKIYDIVVTNHAQSRWVERVTHERVELEEVCTFLWEKLKGGQIEPYYRNEEDVYIIDDDLLMVAEFTAMDKQIDLVGNPIYKMIIVTFLGRMSENLELRDLKSYYSWLRHSRRMTLIKSGRKRK
ncbi:hypothetical protein [Paenibacillus sp. N3.4]|uniref:hypothetical protein n=1 Tax=Paenibacillus sp. N3.4 TaxID=2603222 RepID=UPI0011C70D32|nr:hypothetical protein [Paenibacillus sp. N3.4]TXK73504.1 hypothetical protein FU659_30625 [Paenibacillus sp. N3.4]